MGKHNREVKSNITDNESGRLKTNTGYVQGYNSLAMVDDKNQIIVSAEAFGSVNEGRFFKPMIKQTEEHLCKTGVATNLKKKTILADTSYFAEENYEFIEDKNIDGYIPDNYFRNRDPRFPEKNERRKRKNLFIKDDFVYNEKDNTCTCPAGICILKEWEL